MDQTEQNVTTEIKKPKKKRRIGLYIALGIFLILFGIAFWFIGSIFLFKPKDLGIRYTETDYNKAIEKTGIAISVNGESGQSLKDVTKNTDSDWHYDDFKREKLTLTAPEFSALVDSITPAFGGIQVKATEGGIIEGSTAVSLDVIEKLLGDQKDQLPFDLPKSGSANIYTKLNLSIKDDNVTASALSLEIGSIKVPENLLENIAIEDQLEVAFASVPGLEIHSLTTDENGNFIFDGTYPHSVNITPKN